jgi:hypothetical protein
MFCIFCAQNENMWALISYIVRRTVEDRTILRQLSDVGLEIKLDVF